MRRLSRRRRRSGLGSWASRVRRAPDRRGFAVFARGVRVRSKEDAGVRQDTAHHGRPNAGPNLRQVPPRRPRRWRDEISWASGMKILVGVWLVMSRSVLDYPPDDAAWNPVV